MIEKKNRILSIAALLLAVAFAAWGQIEPQSVITVWQNGEPAGLVFAAERGGTAGNVYAEHWILYPRYIDPAGSNGVVTELIPSRELSFRSEVEFLRAAPWGAGYRYVRTLSYDTAMLPGR